MQAVNINSDELAALISAAIDDIKDSNVAFDGDGKPGLLFVVGYNPKTRLWAHQVSDYAEQSEVLKYPVWSLVGVYRDSNEFDVAYEIIRDIEAKVTDQEKK